AHTGRDNNLAICLQNGRNAEHAAGYFFQRRPACGAEAAVDCSVFLVTNQSESSFSSSKGAGGMAKFPANDHDRSVRLQNHRIDATAGNARSAGQTSDAE